MVKRDGQCSEKFSFQSSQRCKIRFYDHFAIAQGDETWVKGLTLLLHGLWMDRHLDISETTNGKYWQLKILLRRCVPDNLLITNVEIIKWWKVKL